MMTDLECPSCKQKAANEIGRFEADDIVFYQETIVWHCDVCGTEFETSKPPYEILRVAEPGMESVS